ncbi:MAG: hypothetical protein ACTSQY_10160 [Candidatus Odinarchaeia archaeon]
MSPYRLFGPIIELSVADEWHDAAMEWKLETIEYRKEGGYCICGHYIKEHIQIKNMINGNRAIVGNCCITKFPQYSGKISDMKSCFRALKNNKINSALIQFAYDEKKIKEWEYNFMMNIWRKRKLSPKQISKKEQVKRKIFKACQYVDR